jgi:hypothetical protein
MQKFFTRKGALAVVWLKPRRKVVTKSKITIDEGAAPFHYDGNTKQIAVYG